MSRCSSVPHKSRLMARMVALFASLSVLLCATSAAATPAPWCNDAAQSDIAPFPTLPSHNGELRAGTPCHDWDGTEAGRAPAPEREQTAQTRAPERVPPVAPWSLPRDRGRKLTPAIEWQFERPGFVLGVFRPPRTAR